MKELENLKPPTWQINENGDAVGTVMIKGKLTNMVIGEPTMHTVDALACYMTEHPGSMIKAQLLCITQTLKEPKDLSFNDLCDLTFNEGKEVLKAIKCFPAYSEMA